MAEWKHAVQELRLNGVAIASNVNGRDLDEECMLPFFKETESLDAPIFIHPDASSENDRLSKYHLVNVLGYPMEWTLAACELVFGGVLDRYPNLKICLVHAGGALLFLLGRLEHGQSVRPATREGCEHLLPHHLNSLYVDSVAFRTDILGFVMTVMPEGHVFMGTDYPFDKAGPHPVSSVRSTMPDDEAPAGRLLGANLRQLLKIEERRSR